MKFTNYKKLLVWEVAMSMVTKVYTITKTFPKSEEFGLNSQMRRCAVSVPSNIAEGTGRETDKEKLRFVFIARGSLFELETQMDIARSLQFLDENQYNDLKFDVNYCKKLMAGVIYSLKATSS